ETRETHRYDAVGERVDPQGRGLERPAIRERYAARDADPAQLVSWQPEDQLHGGAPRALEHVPDGTFPACGRSRSADLGKDRVADPLVRRDALHGDDLGQALRPVDAHFVVQRVVVD